MYTIVYYHGKDRIQSNRTILSSNKMTIENIKRQFSIRSKPSRISLEYMIEVCLLILLQSSKSFNSLTLTKLEFGELLKQSST